MTTDHLAQAIGIAAGQELRNACDRIQHCVGQLSDEQVWWRPHPAMNSIGNLLLHLCGNVRQWLIVGLGGGVDQRNRPAEFAERGPLPKDALLRQLEAVVSAAQAVLAQQTAQQWLEPHRVQGFDVTGLDTLFSSVPHFRGHTQEIIHLTRVQLGAAYRLAWEPQTREEGAPP